MMITRLRTKRMQNFTLKCYMIVIIRMRIKLTNGGSTDGDNRRCIKVTTRSQLVLKILEGISTSLLAYTSPTCYTGVSRMYLVTSSTNKRMVRTSAGWAADHTGCLESDCYVS